VRNEQTLINLSEMVKGTGIAAIDDLQSCLDKLHKLAHNREILSNFENIFIHV
jgi:hypothetical protein